MTGPRIKNWTRFQHYKSGKNAKRPEWIKLYRNLLDDIEWHNLDGLDAKILVMLWMLASENGGTLPPLREIAFRLRTPEAEINKILQRLPHWVENTPSEVLGQSYTETRLEEEQNKNKKKNKKGADAPVDQGEEPTRTARQELELVLDKEHAKAILDHRDRLKAGLTPYAAKQLADRLRKFPDPNAAADEMIARGWKSIKHDWNAARGSPQRQRSTVLETADRLIEEIESGKYDRPIEASAAH